MSERTATRVFEFSWREQRLWDGDKGFVRTVRIVADYDGKGRLDDLTVEELSTDALGGVQWERMDNCYLPERALAELLKQAGHLSAEEDLSCL